ncbi:MAG: phosphoribosyltransferase domain-containing protein [Myxococcaceae bacterium]|nr:phosphoribosyltransferase domain-containing protein [Myxococcaceae bacterium]
MRKRRVAPRGRKAPKSAKVERIESIPEDVVLAPQAEVPRALAALDRPRRFQSAVKEMSWAEFDRLVQSMALRLKRGFKPDAVVGVAHGGVFVGGAIASALGVEFFPVRISRRSRDRGANQVKKSKLNGEMPKELKGRRVLVVDDVASSGDTLELAKALAEKVGAKAIETACLVCKEEGYRPDYLALATEDLVVFPWDYDLIEDARFGPARR